jgi:membrane protein DedA with SNARE-associated domain
VSIADLMGQIPPALIYVLVGALIGVESIGIPVPGETALIAGALIAAHPASTVTPWGIAGAAFTGAVIGDSIGYSVGRRLGPRLFARLSRRFPRHLSADHIAYAEHLFARWGAGAVFWGRFVALLRILAGPLAGSLKMPYPRFLLANATGGAFWAGSLTWLVYVLGEAAHRWIANAAWAFLAVVVVGGFFVSRRLHDAFQERVEEYARERAGAQERPA